MSCAMSAISLRSLTRYGFDGGGFTSSAYSTLRHRLLTTPRSRSRIIAS